MHASSRTGLAGWDGAPAQNGRSVTSRGRSGWTLTLGLALLWLAVAGTATLAGLDYYLTPLAERAYAESHALYAPTGLVGHSLGIAGSLMMAVGVALYSIRKRSDRLARFGRLSTWLQVHIFLCTLGPFLVLLHTTFKFGGIVSIAFWSMAIVVASGVFGRYVYVRIPKSVNGRFRTLGDIQRRAEALAAAARTEAGLAAGALERLLEPGELATPSGLIGAIVQAVRFDVHERSRARRLRRMLRERGVAADVRRTLVALQRERARLEQQLRLLAPFQRLFRYWHTIHLPLAIVMFVVLVIHVAVAALFGYGWPS